MPIGRVHHDRGARLGVGDRVVVREVFEPGGQGDDRQAVGVEVVRLARHLQAADVGVGRHREGGGGARRLHDAHVESGVVGDESVALDEGLQVGELLGPRGSVEHHVGRDAVDAGVPLDEMVVPEGRLDEPADLVDDLTVAHLDEADGARTGGGAVGRLEVDGGEIERHVPHSDTGYRRRRVGAPRTENGAVAEANLPRRPRRFGDRERAHRKGASRLV